MDQHIVIELHHGGKFLRKTILYYSRGKVNYYYNVDKDLVSYFELKGIVTDLGYKNMSKIYYRSPCKIFESGLRLIVSDNEIPLMLEDSKLTGSIEVYVEHIEDDKLENVGVEDSVHGEDTEGGEGSLGGQETVSGKENMGGDKEGSDEESDLGGYEEENDDESDVNSMDYVSNDDELIEVRQKL